MLLLRLLLPRIHVCSLIGMLALSAVARADAVLVRFYPPAQGAVAGYKVYAAFETTGTITSAPIDAGARPPTGGIANYSLAGLDPSRSYSVELTAYDSRGVESRRSNRVTIAPRIETLGTALWQNSFTAYAPAVHVPGFADSRGDSRTTTGTDLFSVGYFGANDPAYGTFATPGAVASTYTGPESAGWGSYEIAGRVWATSGAAAGVAARATRSDASRQYFRLSQTATGEWTLGARNEPALTCSRAIVGSAVVASHWYSFRFRVTRAAGKTRLRAKLWRFPGAQPVAWQADCWTTTAGSADSGAFALLRDGAGQIFFDDLSVRPVVGTLDPIPPQ